MFKWFLPHKPESRNTTPKFRYNLLWNSGAFIKCSLFPKKTTYTRYQSSYTRTRVTETILWPGSGENGFGETHAYGPHSEMELNVCETVWRPRSETMRLCVRCPDRTTSSRQQRQQHRHWKKAFQNFQSNLTTRLGRGGSPVGVRWATVTQWKNAHGWQTALLSYTWHTINCAYTKWTPRHKWHTYASTRSLPQASVFSSSFSN